MSKVKRAPARRKPTRRKSPRKQTAAASAPRRFRNWVEARIRGARYSAANAARLGVWLVVGLTGTVFAGLYLFGGLDDLGEDVHRFASRQTAEMGWSVASIDITGVEEGQTAEIVHTIGAYEGQPLLEFDAGAARLSVEALPWVRSARVARLWPNRISVIVEPRAEFALWQVDGEMHVIDRDGTVLGETDASAWPDLPLVVGFGANENAYELVELLELHPEISGRVSAAVRVGDRRWNLRLVSGVDIKLPETEVGAALALLSGMHAQRGVLRLEAESIDLRQPGEMIVRAREDRARAAGLREREA